jgi:hypothetical protein
LRPGLACSTSRSGAWPAAAFAARELDWIQGFDYLMDGLDLDPDQLHRVRCLLPAAIRGLSNERQIGFTSDLDIARAALTDAVVALLSTVPR